MTLTTTVGLVGGLSLAVLGAALCIAGLPRSTRRALAALTVVLAVGSLALAGIADAATAKAQSASSARSSAGRSTPAKPITDTEAKTRTTSGAGTSNPTTTADANFHGIYAFSGGNTPDLAGDPDVAGRSLVYYWAQLEPQPGVFRWDLIDQDMAPWVAAGKKVILRVSTAGWASWDKQADSAHGTPAWVYAQGVKSVTEKDGAVLPQYWNPTFLADLDDFVHAFAARYDGNPHVALIDLPVGIGGETKPDSEKNPNLLQLWQAIGYTDPTWWTAVQHIIDTYTRAFTHTPLAVMPDKTFLGNTPGYNEAKTLNYAVARGIGLQDNGLLPGRTLPAPWGQTPVISEQRNPTTTDGNSLDAELQAALDDKATLILVFTADLTNPADRETIHHYASLAQPGGTTGTIRPCPPAPVRDTTARVAPSAIMCPLAGAANSTDTATTAVSSSASATVRGRTASTATARHHTPHRHRTTHTGHTTHSVAPATAMATTTSGGLS
ncbi:beta-galactosidase [Kutzneria buriramensis]|uniref:Beta-galactosidase-like protein n=1 Tax=Kutzneria buriramensis TaxID=1045776 RepID=A0A3E0I951_9PSEU|nr:beta-galactosidase [Kutzneria buriramensis]REH55177.1 beta-galactosidase-like protein [Kutzneria buriramensis]